MPSAHARLSKWSQAKNGDGTAGLKDVRQALDDDLNVPAAISVLDAAVAAGHSISASATLLGINLDN